MYVDEVALLFRTLVDEDDVTFLTPAHVATYLKSGYEVMMRAVAENGPQTMEISTLISVTGRSYDLAGGAVKLLGANATQRRIRRILDIWEEDATGIPQQRVLQVPDLRRLLDLGKAGAYLTGTNLFFNTEYNAQLIRLVYLGEPAIDWTKQTAGQNEWIDDFTDFHELIALEAASLYSIRDGKKNTKLEEHRDALRLDFTAMLCQGRMYDSARHVMRF